MSEKVTRRSFLKKSAAAIGGIAAATVGVEVVTPLVAKEKLEFDANDSLWARAQQPKNKPLNTDIEADVAIIGGGYTGLSAAYHLAKRFPERTIALFEAKGVGQGASGRNGGMILPQPSNDYMAVYSDPQSHKLTYDVTVKNFNELEALIKAQGMDCELDRKGILLVIVQEKQVEEFRKYSEQARSLGIPVEFWDRERTRKEIGTDAYFASVYEPNGGEVHPLKLVYALKKAAETAGAHIYEDSPVLEVQEGEVVRLTVGEQKRQVTAKALVLATNGYTSKLGYFRNTVMAVHTQLAVTPPLTDAVFAEIGWKNRIPFSDTRNILYHAGSTRDNRIMIGAGHVDYFFNNGVVYKGNIREVHDLLKKELVRIYPELAKVDFEYIWNGVMGFTLDFNQALGVTGKHKNIYYGLAYCGHGVNLSTLFGKIIADLYAGEGAQWENTTFIKRRPIPLPPEPLKWVGVQANIAYYKMLDEMGMGART